MTQKQESPTARTMAEILRSPSGAYLAPGTPAMLALETMMETVGTRTVLFALALIARSNADKAERRGGDSTSWRRLYLFLEKIAKEAPAAQ